MLPVDFTVARIHHLKTRLIIKAQVGASREIVRRQNGQGEKMKQYLSAIIVLIFGLFSTGSAVAANGTLNAVSFAGIPTGASMLVRPWDNSDDNIRIAKEFESVLKQRGYRISADANMILSFETKDILGKWDAGERRHLLEVKGSGGRTGSGLVGRAELSVERAH